MLLSENLIMKTLLRISLLALIVLNSFGLIKNLPRVQAAPLSDQSVLTLADIGISDVILHGPYELKQLRFNLSPNWSLQGGMEFRLYISAFTSLDNKPANESNNLSGALLDVSFNGELQQSIPLVNGKDILYTIPIKSSSLVSKRNDGSLEISFFLDASYDCVNELQHTTVLVSSSSQLMVEYADVDLQMDLRRLPWPIYQPGSNLNVGKDKEVEPSALVIVSADASDGELQAALTAMGAFGRMTSQKLPMALVISNELKQNMLETHDLIFVGTPKSLLLLDGLSLPLPIENSHFGSSRIEMDDGVLQMIPSPWNRSKSLLLLGGNTETGVIKAAQALSAGNVLQTGNTAAYSVVSQVNPVSFSSAPGVDSMPLSSPDFTLADLGFKTYTANQVGINWFSFEFIIPPGQIPTEKPYFDLNFTNSDLIDLDRSGFVVYLNGALVASESFSEETSSDISVKRIGLPFSSLLPGRNRIDIAASLFPHNVCNSFFSFEGLWFTIFPESVLHLPLKDVALDATALQDLRAYPYPFLNDPSLSTTTFVLPSSDPSTWSVAGDVAYNLGSMATGAVIFFDAVFDRDLANEALKERNLIVIGLPNELPLLANMGQSMPAQFENGSNVAIFRDQQTIYRFDSDKELGYLELFASPWSSNRSVVTILGTTLGGLKTAGEVLTDSKARAQLRGNFITVDGEQVLVVNTRTGFGTTRLFTALGSDVLMEQTPVPVPELSQSELPATPSSYNRTLILFGLIGVAVLMVAIMVIAVVTRRFGKS